MPLALLRPWRARGQALSCLRNSAGVAEWEEPRDSGLFACCSSNPHSPTLQLFSPPIRPMCIDDGGPAPAKVHSHAVFARGTRWENGAQVVLQPEGLRGRTSA